MGISDAFNLSTTFDVPVHEHLMLIRTRIQVHKPESEYKLLDYDCEYILRNRNPDWRGVRN